MCSTTIHNVYLSCRTMSQYKATYPANTPPSAGMAPVGLGAGARVIARDSKGYWYRAQTPGERREPSEQFRVRFTGFTDKDAERVEPLRINKKFTKALIVQLKAYT